MTLDVRWISSLEHEALADYRFLTDVALRSKSEPSEGIYIAESLKILERALRAGHTPRSVLTLPTWLEKLQELDEHLPGLLENVPVFVGDAPRVESLTGFHVHRGTLASITRPSLPSVQELVQGASRVVVLENIVDHTNVGAIFRSVAGIGADAVIVSELCADPLYRRSVRVSMGTVMQVPWTRAGDWSTLTDTLRANGFAIVALALSNDALSLDTFASQAPDKLALVLGAEGDGLSAEALASAEYIVEIPMHGGVDSLNVAAASAVAMWALRPGATGNP
jgi:tRNA G18 (ribose-2'-O)-methylase SpoU